jgi:glycerol-3-phosphate dehydrogenase subunit B
MGYPVSKVVLRGKRCDGIHVSHPPVAHVHTADRFILATGRFLGGGLVADETGINEPLCTLPVSQPSSRLDWFGRSFFDDHPIHYAGVTTDSSLRPADEKGERILENVWIAGSMLSHHNLIKEKSREGIEISTGTMAAKEALKT